MLIPCDIFLDEIKTWPALEVEQIKKKLGIKKSTPHVQLLQIHKLFMPWHLHYLLHRCGLNEMADWLSKRCNDCPEPTHESFCSHNDNLVKQYIKITKQKGE